MRLVLHDQSDDITRHLDKIHEALLVRGLSADHAIHTAPLIDGDTRPEGRLVHVVGKRASTRKVHGWGARGPRAGVRKCVEQDTHPFLTSGRRTWAVDIDLRCFNHRGHGRLGDSWAASVRVIAANRYDDAPGPSRWIPRITTSR